MDHITGGDTAETRAPVLTISSDVRYSNFCFYIVIAKFMVVSVVVVNW